MESKHKSCQNKDTRKNYLTFRSTSEVKAYIHFEEVTPICIMEKKKWKFPAL